MPDEFPPCFDSIEGYETWLYHAKTSDLAYPEKSFCYDCTPEYKAQMEAEGRCTRLSTRFARVRPTHDGDGFDDELPLCGLSPLAYAVLKRFGRIVEADDAS